MRRLVVLAFAVAPVTGIASPAPADDIVAIQPGAMLRIGNSRCSANFVFTDDQHTYIGTAGHCTGVGAVVSDADRVRIGVTVYSAFTSYPALDFALIQIDAGRLGDVSPAMRYWGGPTGLLEAAPIIDPGMPKWGTLLRQHGFGSTFQERELTQRRSGVLTAINPTTWQGALPCSGGDSGSGVMLATGEALGVLDVATLAVGGVDPILGDLIGKVSPACAGNTISYALAVLRNAGFEDLELATAPLSDQLI